jgi:hypothetical protein
MKLVYKNAESTAQVIDFIDFFNAQNSINVFNLTTHATLKPLDKKLPTKLSTKNVHECLGHNRPKLSFREYGFAIDHTSGRMADLAFVAVLCSGFGLGD